MKKLLTIISVSIILLISLQNCSVMKMAKESYDQIKTEHDERYGSGHFDDVTKGVNDVDKTALISPYQSRINRLFDSGKITAKERDNRKNELNKLYDSLKSKRISEGTFHTSAERLCI